MSKPLENYLAEARNKSGLTQEEIAFLLALADRSTVSEHERFRRLPSLETVLGYEALFGKCMKELFEGLYRMVELQVHNGAVALHARLKEAGRLTSQKHDFLRSVIKTTVGDLRVTKDAADKS